MTYMPWAKGIGTIKWATQFEGMRMSEVRAAKRDIAKVFAKAVDKNEDGLVDKYELFTALEGASKPLRSAVMGAFASAQGHDHTATALSRDLIAYVLSDAQDKITKVNTTKKRTLKVDELKHIKTRMPSRLLDLAKAKRNLV